ncbi:hypothetical protein HanRHA438_Chr17g0840601 [Helianthus annuus]|nr:hypothetical protein HanRHA438_Chr17g0840601 [Helianthus annuus]
MGTMKLGRLAKSVATGVNTKRRTRGLLHHPVSGYLYAKMSIDHHRSLLIYLVSKDVKRKQKMITFSPVSYDFSWSCVCRH